MSEYSNRLTGQLLAGCGVLVLVLGVEMAFPAHSTSGAGATTGEPALPALPQNQRYVPVPMTAYPAALESPIFFQTRRMPQVPVAPAAPPKPLRLRLEGVAVSMDSRIAVLRNLADNQLLQLAPGSRHDGWQLTSVASDSATFDRDGQSTVLVLELSDRPRH